MMNLFECVNMDVYEQTEKDRRYCAEIFTVTIFFYLSGKM